MTGEGPSVAVLTPSWSGDAELCAELNRSVLEMTPWRHHILVASRDRSLFRHLRGERTELIAQEEVLPGGFRPVPGSRRWLSRYTPRPLGGWIIQQLAKLAGASAWEADVVVTVDSDVVLVKEVGAGAFVRDGLTRLFRRPEGITPSMAHHVEWHSNACRLLGVEPDSPPMADYIATILSWSPPLVRAMLERVESATGRPWYSAVARTPQFSEGLLYGAYVDKVRGGEGVWHDPSDHTACYWETVPASAADLDALAAGFGGDDYAVMISSHSGTSLEDRRRLSARLAGD